MKKPVYIQADPAKCICRGKGEYWAVGKAPEIFNVFSVYPNFPDLDERLIPCQQHRRVVMNIADHKMLADLGIALSTASLPEE